jgi:RNA polymerase sigma factor (sigma-70 family)
MCDQELVLRAQQGDHEAFAELYRRYRRFVGRASASMAGNRHDGDDVASVAMLALYRAILNGGGPTRGSVGGYLLHAVRTAVRDQGQSAARLQSVVTSERACARGVDTHDADDSNDVVRAALGALPARWQELLVAVDVEGHPLCETATRMGMSPNAAAAAMMRARKGLRRGVVSSQRAVHAEAI